MGILCDKSIGIARTVVCSYREEMYLSVDSFFHVAIGFVMS